MQQTAGLAMLFYGGAGCGKSATAEAIGSELGKPLLVINIAALLSRHFYRSNTLQKIFKEAKERGAVLVFEGCELLVSDNPQVALDIGVLSCNIQTFSGIVILITRFVNLLGKTFTSQFKHTFEFKLPAPEYR
jgi:AAA+ superfamily predicted ATPase